MEKNIKKRQVAVKLMYGHLSRKEAIKQWQEANTLALALEAAPMPDKSTLDLVKILKEKEDDLHFLITRIF